MLCINLLIIVKEFSRKIKKLFFLTKGEAGGFLPMKGTAHIINYEWQNFGDLDNFSIGVC